MANRNCKTLRLHILHRSVLSSCYSILTFERLLKWIFRPLFVVMFRKWKRKEQFFWLLKMNHNDYLLLRIFDKLMYISFWMEDCSKMLKFYYIYLFIRYLILNSSVIQEYEHLYSTSLKKKRCKLLARAANFLQEIHKKSLECSNTTSFVLILWKINLDTVKLLARTRLFTIVAGKNEGETEFINYPIR